MTMETIKLGGFVGEEVAKINSNFANAATKDELFSGSYNDLTDKPTIPTVPEVPENVSAFTNDAGYQTAAQVTATVTAAVGNKVDKVSGKGLSTNDYTTDEKTKVSKLGTVTFTASDWSAQSDGYYTTTIGTTGRECVKVMRQNGTDHEECLCHVKKSGTNIILVAAEAFAGYVVTM